MSGSAPAHIPTQVTTTDQVVAALREQILDGSLTPGTPLREVTVSSNLQVSRNTLREALRVLTHEGLVRYRPHRGVVVTDLSASEVADIYGARLVLEIAAVEPATRDRECARAVRRVASEFGAAFDRRSYRQMIELDLELHSLIVGALGSARIDGFYRATVGELKLALLRLDQLYADRAQVEQHATLGRLLEQRKAAEAKTLLHAHLDAASASLQSHLASPVR